MKKIWHIGFNDIKLMVRDKVFFFWTLIFPLVFIFIFGNIYKEDTTIKASLMVLNQDRGQWGAHFVEKLKAPDILLEILDEEPESYHRILIIPEDFSENIRMEQSQSLIFKKNKDANVNAAAQAETKIIQAIAKTITELILHGSENLDTFFEGSAEFKDIVKISTQFPEGASKKIPGGFDHTVPGVIVQFIMMMVLIYGGVTVMEDRKRGVLTRILYSAVSVPELWGGKFLGRFMMGIVQALILIIAGILLFGLNVGNFFLFMLNILIFSFTIASLGIFIGSVLGKEDLIIGVSVLSANVFAALGGCWWPIEIVSPAFRRIAVISPAYWAMDSFHKIVFFNKGLEDIALNLFVLLIWSSFFTYLAVKYFRIKD